MIADPKEDLHRLVDALPESDVVTARRVLEALVQLAASDGGAGIEARTSAAAPPHGTTRLEDYFDFSSPDEIRIQGHRIWIEHVLYEYIHRSRTAEQIAQHFETLTLDEIYATILYYLRNKEAVSGTFSESWGSGKGLDSQGHSPYAVSLRRCVWSEPRARHA